MFFGDRFEGGVVGHLPKEVDCNNSFRFLAYGFLNFDRVNIKGVRFNICEYRGRAY